MQQQSEHPQVEATGAGRPSPDGKWSLERLLWLSAAGTAVAVLVVAAVARLAFGFTFTPRGMLGDLIGLWPLALLLLWATRSFMRMQALLLLAAGLFGAGQVVSLAMLGAPLRLTDVLAVPTLVSVMPVGLRVATMAGLAVAALVLLWLLRVRLPRLPALVVGLALLGTAFVPGGWGHRLASRAMPDVGMSPGAQVAHAGALAFLLAENAGRQVVGVEEVAGIVGDSSWQVAYEGPRRNIHLVLLETFWDPLRLKHYRFSEDPFDPRFRAMLEQSQGSMALTPHFGHLTANAEFESLCGLPATEQGAIFVNSMRNPVPCLPRILDDLGYRTQASHANAPTSWGRDNAYARVGFSRFNSALSFEIDDTDELFLTDASFYRQNIAGLEQERGQPLFNYLVSLSSHWPYKRNKKERPDVIAVEPGNDPLRDYVNGLRYSSKAFADWVEEVLRRDPDALIVAYGDHAPVMPPSQDVYTQSGYSMGNHDKLSDEQLLELSGTPLLVIDGRKGVRPVGTMPVSSLPDLVLELAFGDGVALPQTRILRDSVGPGVQARRYLGRLLAGGDGHWRSCPVGEAPGAGGEACDDARRLLREGETLREDMTSGESHFTRLVHVQDKGTGDPAGMELATVGCGVDVARFGPRDIKLGSGFNVQKGSGKSAMWFNLTSRRGNPRIRIGRDEAPLEMNGLFGAAGWAAPGFVNEAGEHQVYVVCDGAEDVAIGSVHVSAPGQPLPARWKEADVDFPVDLAAAYLRPDADGMRLQAWVPRAACANAGWRAPVRVAWSIPGDGRVQLLVRSSDADEFKLWSSGGGEGKAMTGEWGHDGLQIRVERNGQPWADFTVDGHACLVAAGGA